MSKKLCFGVAALVFAMVLFGYSPAGALNPCAAIDLAPPGMSISTINTTNANADAMNAPQVTKHIDQSALSVIIEDQSVLNSSPPLFSGSAKWALSFGKHRPFTFTAIPGQWGVGSYRLAWIDFSTDTQYIEYQAGKDILHNKMLIEDLVANSSPPLSANSTTNWALHTTDLAMNSSYSWVTRTTDSAAVVNYRETNRCHSAEAKQTPLKWLTFRNTGYEQEVSNVVIGDPTFAENIVIRSLSRPAMNLALS